MKKNVIKWFSAKQLLAVCCVLCMFPYQQMLAQNKKPGAGGNKPSVSKPAANKPSPSVNKPAANNNKPSVNKPEANNSKPDVKRPDAKSDNGVADRKTDVSNSGNKTNNVGSGNKKVNVDNSKKNVNVNVDKSKDIHVNNSRNTSVRHNSRAYGRPPYVYGGRRYRCYRPYYFHPYRPFIWGPRWHPWGFFIATLAATAIILSVDNNMPGDLDMAKGPVFDNSYYSVEAKPFQLGPSYVSYASYTENQAVNNDQPLNAAPALDGEYYYDEGVYYLKGDGGYTVVSAPLGAKIKTLPTGYETVSVDDNTKNYYYGGTFYEKTSAGYTVVAPTAGTIVLNVSDGAEEVKMGDVTYVKLGETYFQPINEGGKDMYEVADVEEDK
jgi:Family of unknown function (DUF6515)